MSNETAVDSVAAARRRAVAALLTTANRALCALFALALLVPAAAALPLAGGGARVAAPVAPLAPTLGLAPWALVVVPPALALYRRIRRRDVLDSLTRRRVLARVKADPGVTVGAVAKRLDRDYKTVAHHMRVLREFGFVEARPEGRLTRYYPAGDAPRRRKGPGARASPTARQLLHLVAQSPGITQAEVARRLGVSRSTIKWHVDRLESHGLVDREPHTPGLDLAPHDVEDAVEDEPQVGP